MKTIQCDVAVIGAGGAGLAGAAASVAAGAETCVIDREDQPGGVLVQCIHNGFGVRYFNAELTGSEYAARIAAESSGAHFLLGHMVHEVRHNDDGSFEAILCSGKTGVVQLHAKALLFATGCRERTRANLTIPGDRGAGVYTAGTAQKLMNLFGRLPGTRAVIIGSGDIGLIMARRCRWCGMAVEAVVEILPEPSGLPRNIYQCLTDFGTPLLLSHRTLRINGRDRVESVDIEDMKSGEKKNIPCDTVLFSVGLIPENELLRSLGIPLSPATGGAEVDADFQCAVPGVFAAGNSLHVHDIVDFVSFEARKAGTAAAQFAKNGKLPESTVAVTTDPNLKYAIPQRCRAGVKCGFYFRPTVTAPKARLCAFSGTEQLFRRNTGAVRPAEMLQAELEIPAQARKIRFELEIQK